MSRPKRRTTQGGGPPGLKDAPVSSAGRGWLAALLIAAAAGLAYSNSFRGPFVFDDTFCVLVNPYVRSFWPPWNAFRAPWQCGTGLRPLVNFSIAVNRAISGEGVWSFHALNLAVHVLAALTLFGVVRRTLSWGRLGERYGAAATPLALACALLWAVHPLHTMAVTYVIQRCMSMAGLFFLLTLYCAVRGWQSPGRTRWPAAAVAACLLGAGSNEALILAPLVVFLYAWVFLGGSVGEAFRRSWRLYLGLLACAGVLAAAVAAKAVLRATVGVPWRALRFPSVLEYARTQPEVILHYLRLAVWPAPLCLDYGWPLATWGEAAPCIAAVGLLGVACLAALWRRHPLGFVGAWFFVTLAPTSSFWPLTDPAFEHRMYLPLAAVVVTAVLGGYEAWRRWGAPALGPSPRRGRMARLAGAGLVGALAVALGTATFLRNRDYRSGVSLWSDTARKRPENPRAHQLLGVELALAGDLDGAVSHFREALRLARDYPEAHYNLGLALCRLGRLPEGIEHFQEAVRLDPRHSRAHGELGISLCKRGELPDGTAHLEEARRLDPADPEICFSLGIALELARKPQEAMASYEEALRLKPEHARAHGSLGGILCQLGDLANGIAHLREALRLAPTYPLIQYNLGQALELAGTPREAAEHYREALRLDPGFAEARKQLELLEKQQPGKLRLRH